jgi:hypothetical protein
MSTEKRRRRAMSVNNIHVRGLIRRINRYSTLQGRGKTFAFVQQVESRLESKDGSDQRMDDSISALESKSPCVSINQSPTTRLRPPLT